jgi:hypothetical protein
VSLTDVQELLGHANAGVTARIYSHALKAADDRFAERLGELVAIPPRRGKNYPKAPTTSGRLSSKSP